MLDALRRGASGWLAKILFFILILAFAVWGIPTSLNLTPNYVAKVGNTEISVEEFQNTFQNQLNMLAQFGQRMTPEQAQARGVHLRALIGLIDTAAVDEHAKSLNLGVSPETTALQIAREPTFIGPSGQFDKNAFEAYLRQIRMSEQGFLAARAKDEVREQITGTLQVAAVVPPAMIDVLYAWGEEQRKATHVTLPQAAAKFAEPDEAKLKETWEQTKRQFALPETRKLGALLLSLEKLKAGIKIADADIKAYYDANRDSLDIPDRRRVQTIRFKDKSAAETAKKAIEGGKSFLMVALETEGAGGQMPELLAKSDIGELTLAQKLFELPLDKVSEVVPTGSGAALYMVTEAVPGKKRTLDEAKDEIRDKLVSDKVSDELKARHDAVDNLRAGRKPLKDIAAELKLDYLEATTTADNKTADGKPAFDSPALDSKDAEKLVANGFAGTKGVDGEIVDLVDGGIGWVDVLEVTPEKVKPFDEVKDKVKEIATDVTRRAALTELANKLVERIDKGEAMDAIAKEVGAKLETTDAFKRASVPQGLSANAVELAFASAKRVAISAESADRKSRTVLMVTDIVVPPAASAEQKQRLNDVLAQQIQGDALQQYSTAMRDQVGYKINQPLVQRALGTGESQ